MAAALLFAVEGYETASMSRIARQAGVTSNTLYWYFRDKDELLVAVADQFLEAMLAGHAAIADRPLEDQLRWLVEQLRPVRRLVATVHDRTAAAESVREWHEHFHTSFEHVFEAQLPGPLAEDRRATELAIATFALEGAITHPLDDVITRQLCAEVAGRLIDATT